MEQKIFFNYNTDSFPKIILANEVFIHAPNCHFTRTPSEYILYFIIDGSMLLKEDDEIYTLKKGDCILLDPSRTHMGIRSNDFVHYYYIHFQANLTQNYFSGNDFSKLFIQNRISSNSTDLDTFLTKDTLWLPKHTFF